MVTPQDTATAVIGAGPYGLSIAAHLGAANSGSLVFGRPMEYWQGMPMGMFLRSAWSATSLSDPKGDYSLDRYVAVTGTGRPHPVPVNFFIDYAMWFQRHAVPDVDGTDVRSLRRTGRAFLLELTDGRTVSADRVVIAVGIKNFAHLPEFARGLPAELATHSQMNRDPGRFRGQRVAVIGGGQSALECAALMHENGADVEVVARRPVRWLTLHDYHGPAHRLLHAPSDVGPPGINWLTHFPLVFRHLPFKPRQAIARRAVRPAGARWLHDRVVGQVRLTIGAQVRRAVHVKGRIRLELDDGTNRELDHLLLATGYRPDVRRLPFLDAALREEVRAVDGFPVLNRWLESSVPGLHFVGALGGREFGPICRFVSGAGISARQVTDRALQSADR